MLHPKPDHADDFDDAIPPAKGSAPRRSRWAPVAALTALATLAAFALAEHAGAWLMVTAHALADRTLATTGAAFVVAWLAERAVGWRSR